MSTTHPTDPEALLSVAELGAEFGLAERTVWLVIKRHDLPRYRVPSRGRATLVKRGDFDHVRSTPILISRTQNKKGDAAA